MALASGHGQFETHLWHWTVVALPSSVHNPAWKRLDLNSHIPLPWEPFALNCLCYCKGGLGLSCLRNHGALFINQGSSPQEFIYCTSLNAQSTSNPLPIQDLRSLSRKCSFSLFFWVSRCLLSSAAGGAEQLRSKDTKKQGTGLSSGAPGFSLMLSAALLRPSVLETVAVWAWLLGTLP